MVESVITILTGVATGVATFAFLRKKLYRNFFYLGTGFLSKLAFSFIRSLHMTWEENIHE